MTARMTRCVEKNHRPFHVPNIDGIILCATCWYLKEQEVQK